MVFGVTTFLIIVMISRDKKEKIVEDLSNLFQSHEGIVFVDFTGLTTSELEELKKNLRTFGGNYKVVKKSLLPFVSKKIGINLNLESHKGSLAAAYEKNEGVGIAKALSIFKKSHESLIILGGLLSKVFVPSDKVKELAALPGREELLGKLMYILSPASSLVRTLASPIAGLANIINSIKSNH